MEENTELNIQGHSSVTKNLHELIKVSLFFLLLNSCEFSKEKSDISILQGIQENLVKMMNEETKPDSIKNISANFDEYMRQLLSTKAENLNEFAALDTLASMTEKNEQNARYTSSYIIEHWENSKEDILKTPISFAQMDDLLSIAEMMRVFATSYASTNPQTNNIYAQKMFSQEVDQRNRFFDESLTILELVLNTIKTLQKQQKTFDGQKYKDYVGKMTSLETKSKYIKAETLRGKASQHAELTQKNYQDALGQLDQAVKILKNLQRTTRDTTKQKEYQMAIIKSFANKHHVTVRKIESLMQQYLNTYEDQEQEHKILANFHRTKELKPYLKELNESYDGCVKLIKKYPIQGDVKYIADQLALNHGSVLKHAGNRFFLKKYKNTLDTIIVSYQDNPDLVKMALEELATTEDILNPTASFQYRQKLKLLENGNAEETKKIVENVVGEVKLNAQKKINENNKKNHRNIITALIAFFVSALGGAGFILQQKTKHAKQLKSEKEEAQRQKEIAQLAQQKEYATNQELLTLNEEYQTTNDALAIASDGLIKWKEDVASMLAAGALVQELTTMSSIRNIEEIFGENAFGYIDRPQNHGLSGDGFLSYARKITDADGNPVDLKIIGSCDATGHGITGALTMMAMRYVMTSCCIQIADKASGSNGSQMPRIIADAINKTRLELDIDYKKATKKSDKELPKMDIDFTMLFELGDYVYVVGKDNSLYILGGDDSQTSGGNNSLNHQENSLIEIKVSKAKIFNERITKQEEGMNESCVTVIKKSNLVGKMVVMASDGIPDQFVNKVVENKVVEKKLLVREFRNMLSETYRPDITPQDFANAVSEKLKRLQGTTPNTDDCTLMALRYSPYL